MADYRRVIDENPKGRLEFINDELKITSLRYEGEVDYPKLRFDGQARGLGGISYNRNGRELALITMDPEDDGYCFQMNPSGGTTDGDMEKLVRVKMHEAEYLVPLVGQVNGAPVGNSFAIQTAHGFYLCVTPEGRLETRTQVGPWETFRLQAV